MDLTLSGDGARIGNAIETKRVDLTLSGDGGGLMTGGNRSIASRHKVSFVSDRDK